MIKLRKSISEVLACATAKLRAAGATSEVAEFVVSDLIENEIFDYRSHGLMRLVDYLSAIESCSINPSAVPAVTYTSAASARIDANLAFGAVTIREWRRVSLELLRDTPIISVAMNKSAHIGRLAHVILPIVRAGYVCLVFANFFGGPKRVAPWGCQHSRLSTNPMGLGFPRRGKDPIIFDMSTCAVSEGRVRAALADGCHVPDGWLVDANWRSVAEPSLLYENPPRASIAPLGGVSSGYKGFGLALSVEILAGILSGTSCLSKGFENGQGNGGVLIAFRPEIFGLTLDAIESQIDELLVYCGSSPASPGYSSFRIPRVPPQDFTLDPNLDVDVEEQVWRRICQ